MEQGNLSNVEWFRGIGEYKIDWGPGLRIYLGMDGLKIVILIGGGTKKASAAGHRPGVGAVGGLQTPQDLNPERSEMTWH